MSFSNKRAAVGGISPIERTLQPFQQEPTPDSLAPPTADLLLEARIQLAVRHAFAAIGVGPTPLSDVKPSPLQGTSTPGHVWTATALEAAEAAHKEEAKMAQEALALEEAARTKEQNRLRILQVELQNKMQELASVDAKRISRLRNI
jgi:hypothetical protein